MIGCDIKDRAKTTTVGKSQMYVGAVDLNAPACASNPGSTSLGFDVPNGGQVVITGVEII